MRPSMKTAGAGVIMGSAALVLCLTVGAARNSLALPGPEVKDVYLDKCAVCHGKDGSGKTAKGKKLKVRDLRSPDVQKLSEAEMIDIVAKGKGKDMDGYEKEPGKDMVKSLVEHYRSMATAH